MGEAHEDVRSTLNISMQIRLHLNPLFIYYVLNVNLLESLKGIVMIQVPLIYYMRLHALRFRCFTITQSKTHKNNREWKNNAHQNNKQHILNIRRPLQMGERARESPCLPLESNVWIN